MIHGNKKVPSNHPLHDSQGINEHRSQFWLPRKTSKPQIAIQCYCIK